MKLPIKHRIGAASRTALFALFFATAASSASAQSFAVRDAESTGYSNTPIGPASQYWDPVAGAAALQNSIDYATNITNIAINDVNTANATAGSVGANVTNLTAAANNSYNNSVAIYNYANGVAGVSSNALAAASVAYSTSVNSANTANSSYDTIQNVYNNPPASASPHVIISFTAGACNFGTGTGPVTANFADGTQEVFTIRCDGT